MWNGGERALGRGDKMEAAGRACACVRASERDRPDMWAAAREGATE